MIKYLILFLVNLPLFLSAQGYRIEVELPNQAGKNITLAYHYLDKIYGADTIKLDASGTGVFASDTLLPQGLYKILIDKDHHFDFLLGADQQFHLYNATAEAKNMKIDGCKETEAFVDYLVYLDGIRQKSQQLNKELKTVSGDQRKEITKEIGQLTVDMKSYWEKIDNELPGSFLYKFLTANEVPTLDISTLPKEVQQNDSLLLLARFEYQKQHFWDNFDYTDERFLYTPFFKPKLETWFNKVLFPAYDSVKPYVYQFLGEVESHPKIFQFATSLFLNSSINSNVLGMDALFVDLANDYYLNGQAFWAGKETVDKIRENVLFMKNNLIGETAPDLLMQTLDGEYVDLHQVDAKLTVVLIYEPNCGHCQAYVPPFYKDVYLPYKDKGLKVFAIYSMDNRQEWEDFLAEHNMYDWINVWDKDDETRFKILYDGRITPGVYVLDRDKKIIAKKLGLEQIKELIAQKLR